MLKIIPLDTSWACPEAVHCPAGQDRSEIIPGSFSSKEILAESSLEKPYFFRKERPCIASVNEKSGKISG